MTVETILLLLLVLMQAVIFIMLWRLLQTRRQQGQELGAEVYSQLESLERRFYENVRDLRSEQNTLARAARMESQAASDRLGEQLDKKLEKLTESTAANLEQIRLTVDEKLQSTLERRLGESFQQVSLRLEQVHRGLGEMQTLAGGVGDLKRILSNVKNRGIWGEMQLGVLLRDLLAPEQFAENVAVKQGTAERVEFALKLPGSKDETVWLPIDAKFPQEDFQRLLEAREQADTAAADIALKQLERRLKSEARDIQNKYLCPPQTTDFAIMYLPIEGLFAEAVNLPGLLDELQRTYRVCVAGPTTLAALLNSLQMGFKTLAIEKRTGEVWRTIAAVKQDFVTFSLLLDKTKKKLQEASGHIDAAARRSRVINKRLDGRKDEEDTLEWQEEVLHERE
ncbi:DNA recombination protein RmuC [Phascolarctobacterium faecium]|jgi:DNA recombination protein RmuC|uniref:DNA recombination protein RmuC n=1 Tax=Phascolarctobacterium faecium TaxID=33025 RepID=UPI001D2A4F1A|nr:DNA recombination protein RmuC [Phascolarctobacterium faecium]MBS1330860.1 DNA recombination protein RmuC [Acidaminococcaceae bacterium]